MKGETKEQWLKLCEAAAQEQDADKLLELVEEINRLLDEKQRRLRNEDDEKGSQAGKGQKQ